MVEEEIKEIELTVGDVTIDNNQENSELEATKVILDL